MTWEALDQGALESLAARIARVLRPGDVVVLAGEVGAGKTTFVRAAAAALGVQERVTSPTYQLARGYEGTTDGGRRIAVNHLDLYRLEGLEDRDALELDDYLDRRAVTFIEWAEPALGHLAEPTVVRLEHETPETRRLSVEGPVAERIDKDEERRPC
ncbi:MAG TPA: tRNA (adenosine(37)-N6)-threonylcarbamoyltransferase complex ATPase subunit type 1 TsaE [Rubrobacteraceae bacterium]|nr:tRNA (adenosine(37)-N6)-threonylcarbamoyltransferase complex ATPase subunit type 1 TsaE [Rubrobacteraceae bacterium]